MADTLTLEEQVGVIVDRYEGDAYTNDPADPGGPTRYGVTLATLQAYRRRKTGNPALVVAPVDIQHLTRAEAIDIGVTQYAVETGLAFILDPGLRFVALDYAFHAGPRAAIVALQMAVGGVAVDGICGALTLDAVNRHHNPVQLGVRMLARRAETLQRQIAARPQMAKYALGWFARVTSNMRLLAAGLVCLLALWATPAPAQDRKTPIALGAYMVAGFWDATGTAYCSGQGTCREVNPLLAPIVDRRGVVPAMTIKGAMHVGISAWLLHDRQQHPKRAFWTAVGLFGAQMAVNVGNARRLGGPK